MNGRNVIYEGIMRAQKAVHKKISKPVRWNGQVFESRTKLAIHLGYSSSAMITIYMKKKKPLKGHVPEAITKEKYEQNKTI